MNVAIIDEATGDNKQLILDELLNMEIDTLPSDRIYGMTGTIYCNGLYISLTEEEIYVIAKCINSIFKHIE